MTEVGWIEYMRDTMWLMGPAAYAQSAEKTARLLRRASYLSTVGATVFSDARLVERFDKGAGILGEMADTIEGALEVRATYNAVTQMYSALKDITPETIRRDPQRAALAFGQVFAGAGQLASYVPGLSVYADFLQGFEFFFADMQKLMDPASPYTVKGRAMRQALDAQDTAF